MNGLNFLFRGLERLRSSLTALNIRTSLLLGFGAMGAVVVLAAVTVLVGTAKISESLDVILNNRLPDTVTTLRVARDTDALVVTAVLLSSVTTDAERSIAFQRADKAVHSLEQTLADLARTGRKQDEMLLLTRELTDNLQKMRDIVDKRIELARLHQAGRERLLTNLQEFKQGLTYRMRILEGDYDVIGRLLSRPSPPLDRILKIAGETATLHPVSRFYTDIETIAGRVLAAIQDPTLAKLQVSRQILKASLNDASLAFTKFPAEIAGELAGPFEELQELVVSESGLLALREHELKLETESMDLVEETKRRSYLVDAATADLVRGGLEAMAKAGQTANATRQRYVLLLLLVTGCGLLAIAAFMHFYVMRHVVLRLSWLSEAMQQIAAKKYNIPLPPAGDNEIGRLGFAVRQFHEITVDADRREAELRTSNQQLERARAEIEEKARELELANARLEELSVTDFLTGLANRRRFEDTLKNEWARAVRTGQSLAVIMIDVDNFKKFNDRYGHQAGDECLKNVATAMKENTGRAGDLSARYGGEEFCVIAAATDARGVISIAEKIRRAVQDLHLEHEDSMFGVVTVSAGCAVTVPCKIQSAEELIRDADLALYEAKTRGRNRSICKETMASGNTM